MISRGKRALKLALEKNDCTEPPCKKRLSPDGDAGYWCQASLDKPGLKKAWINHYIAEDPDYDSKHNKAESTFESEVDDETLCEDTISEVSSLKRGIQVTEDDDGFEAYDDDDDDDDDNRGDDDNDDINSDDDNNSYDEDDYNNGDDDDNIVKDDDDDNNSDDDNYLDLAKDPDYDPKHNKAESTFESEVDGETLCEDTISEVSSLKRGIQVTEDDDGFEAYDDDDDDEEGDDDNNGYDNNDYNNGDDDDNNIEDDDDYNNNDDDDDSDLAKDPDYDPKQNKAESMSESEADSETLCEDTISEGYLNSNYVADSMESGESDSSETFLTSTKLRKQLATLAQILNLSETSQLILATFQGHNIRIHQEYYRLPEDAMQIAKVSKILHTLNEGNIAKYKGKDFDEIQMEDKATLESESNSDEILEDNADNDFSSTQSTATNSQHMTIKSNLKKLETGQKSRHHWSSEEKRCLEKAIQKSVSIRENTQTNTLP